MKYNDDALHALTQACTKCGENIREEEGKNEMTTVEAIRRKVEIKELRNAITVNNYEIPMISEERLIDELTDLGHVDLITGEHATYSITISAKQNYQAVFKTTWSGTEITTQWLAEITKVEAIVRQYNICIRLPII